MVPRQSFWLIAVLLPLLLLASVQRANASGVRQATTDTPTPTETATPAPTQTPTPTSTPAYVTAITLDSGNQLVIERRWTFGELGIFLAVVANAALYGLHWIYEITRREAR
jgi:hypothetical protein